MENLDLGLNLGFGNETSIDNLIEKINTLEKGIANINEVSNVDMFTNTLKNFQDLKNEIKQIKELLKQEDTEILHHLKKQLVLMQKEKQKLLTLIDTLEKTIESRERKITMSIKEKFKGFTYQDNEKYKQKAIDLYGKEVIEEAVKKQKGREQEIADGFNNIFFAISDNMSKGLKATSKENTELAKKLHKHICEYSFDCSADVFSSIGYGYVKNPEFKNNMDKFGEGMAQYLCDAIQQYVKEI